MGFYMLHQVMDPSIEYGYIEKEKNWSFLCDILATLSI